MRVIDNCGGPPSLHALKEAYNYAVLSGFHPTHMFVPDNIAKWFIKTGIENQWGQPIERHGWNIYQFNAAEMVIDNNITNSVWFRNYAYPELDVVLTGVRMV